MLLSLMSSIFVDGWRVIDPNFRNDADDPTALPLIEALLAPAYWGLFMTVILSMYQLGVMIQRILDEIDSKGLRRRYNLAYLFATVYLIGLSALCFVLTNVDDYGATVDLVFSLPLFILAGCVFLFARSKMTDLRNF